MRKTKLKVNVYFLIVSFSFVMAGLNLRMFFGGIGSRFFGNKILILTLLLIGLTLPVLYIFSILAIYFKLKEVISKYKEKYLLLIDNTQDVIFYLFPDSTIISVNSAFKKLTGWVDFNGKKLCSVIYPEDFPKVNEAFQYVLDHHTAVELEIRILSRSNKIITGECSLSITKKRNQIFCCIFRNITKQKEMEEALRLSEIRNRALLNAIPDLTFRINLAGTFLDFIASKNDDWAMHPKEFIGKSIVEMIPEMALEIMFYVEKAIKKSETQTFEYQLHFKGNIQSYKARVVACEKNEALVIIRNITESKLIEKALLESEQKYRYLVEHANDGICITQNMKVKYTNQQLAKILGYTAEEMIGTAFTDYIPLDQNLKITKLYKRHVACQNNFYIYETDLTHREGSRITVELSGCLINYNGHQASLVLVRDTTKRKQAEEALIAEKERLAVTLCSIGDAVITTDTEGKVVLINQVAEQLTGWTQKEAIGKPLSKVFFITNEKTSEPCESPVEKVFKQGTVVGLEKDTVLISRDGQEKFIAASCAPIRNRKQKLGVVLVFRDVSGRQKMEEELLKAQKLESVGILAGGIAHDFNNILAGILANTQLIKLVIVKGRDITKYLNGIEEATIRASALTQQLLTFSKGGAPIKRIASISDLIRDTVDFALRGSNVKCDFYIPNDLWSVELDEGQMSQVINNLIINGIQAMPQGGVITVLAENLVFFAKSDVPLKEGKYVKISFQDQGVGIPEEHLSKIFDPYFTTKHKGNGLGLTTSYSIIKKHDGYINVESKVGIGTIFNIFLPATEDKILVSSTSEMDLPLKGDGKILFMDDEETIKNVIGEMLVKIGYQVEFAQNGTEVINLYKVAKESGEPFDAVIMDLTIPGGMGGKETISKLQEIDPKVKAIVSSGYFNDPVMANFQEYGFSEVVAKPYKIEELNQTLCKVIKAKQV